MAYAVKEIFYSLQGEGAQVGRPAVFCRFAGCNLWTGLERDRAEAVCQFCDTDFVGADGPDGGVFETAEALTEAVRRRWPEAAAPSTNARPFVVCTVRVGTLRCRMASWSVATNAADALPPK